jgi:hypothetical protein
MDEGGFEAGDVRCAGVNWRVDEARRKTRSLRGTSGGIATHLSDYDRVA